MRSQQQHLHRSWQIRQPAPQSKLRELHPKGSLRLLCAGDAENVNQPGFSVEPKFISNVFKPENRIFVNITALLT